MNIIYLLSRSFQYSKLICSDAGPEYASQQGWKCGRIGDKLSDNNIYIFDNRIEESDYPHINACIKEASNILIFKLVDGMEEAIEKDNVKFLFSMSPQKNIFFYSPYKESFALNLLRQKHGNDKILFVPYAYDRKKEIKAGYRRKNQILISGNLSSEAYPLRWKFHINTYHKLWALDKTKYLAHPGYQDIGMKLRHSIYGDKYIQFLSKFKFMLVTPSKWDYELLKYRECAYAGCVLVGKLPSTIDLPQIPGFIALDSNIKQAVKTILKKNDNTLEDWIKNYRHWFTINRNSDILNEQIIKQVSN